jgi:hypothetical protein
MREKSKSSIPLSWRHKKTPGIVMVPGETCTFMLLLFLIRDKLIIILFRNVLIGLEVVTWKQRVDFILRK